MELGVLAMELKPCPFCGGTDIRGFVNPGTHRVFATVQCRDCRGSVARCVEERGMTNEESMRRALEDAAAAWNRRAERTCRDIGGEEDTNFEHYDFGCSECGYACDLPEPNYCPNCGAKVIEVES